jgi:L-seryl-tRNA(Ser) seleniumtransferase
MTTNKAALASIPSIDAILHFAPVLALVEMHGREPVTSAARETLATLRKSLTENNDDSANAVSENRIVSEISILLEIWRAPSLRDVFNLTGTVLHTNLGRALLPEEAITAMITAGRNASNLEFDLATGKRGDRDDHLNEIICRLTGAEDATVVNNNAAAVLLCLNTLALRKEVPVSRGELIEIGGSFRIPDIMSRAGCKLIEVGTTNRTHLKDFAGAIGKKTSLLMKVHTSNYAIEGFTKSVPEKELAALAHDHDLPFIIDLGSGTLIDLAQFGLPHEPTAQEAFAQGADLVSFSGDKLLGGPQAGIIAGRADLIAKIKSNPMKRAMRLDKVTIAALTAVLQLYTNPEKLAERLPTVRLLSRSQEDIRALAARLSPALNQSLGERFDIVIKECSSQIGSGSLPLARIPSAALVIRSKESKKKARSAIRRLTDTMRTLPCPVIGRIQDNALWLDLRCLEDDERFTAQLINLKSAIEVAP